MIFQAVGNKENPAVLFFHAMGVTGESSRPVAEYLNDRYYCIMPTSTVYCVGQKYISKADELRQLEAYLARQRITELALVVASSLGADLACAFLAETKLAVHHVFFDGGQFARIGKATRHIMMPFLYLAVKSYFIAAGKALTYGDQRRQMLCSLEDKPFPVFPEELQKHTFFEFGSIEEHFKFRGAVMKAYRYIKEYRLEQAAVELVRSGKSVTEIAQQAGYDNASKFSESFKKRYGKTPSRYRADKKNAVKRSIKNKTE